MSLNIKLSPKVYHSPEKLRRYTEEIEVREKTKNIPLAIQKVGKRIYEMIQQHAQKKSFFLKEKKYGLAAREIAKMADFSTVRGDMHAHYGCNLEGKKKMQKMQLEAAKVNHEYAVKTYKLARRYFRAIKDKKGVKDCSEKIKNCEIFLQTLNQALAKKF